MGGGLKPKHYFAVCIVSSLSLKSFPKVMWVAFPLAQSHLCRSSALLFHYLYSNTVETSAKKPPHHNTSHHTTSHHITPSQQTTTNTTQNTPSLSPLSLLHTHTHTSEFLSPEQARYFASTPVYSLIQAI